MATKPRTRRHRPVRPADPSRLEGETFEGLKADELRLAGAIVSDCTFVRCDLTEASLVGAHLANCTFKGCELGLIDLQGAALSQVTFDTCRLTGVRFEEVSQLPLVPEVRFSDCDLSFCSFRDLDLTLFAFLGCRLWEAELVGCDLSGVDFAGSDMARCTIARNDLKGADLRRARNYFFSPAANNVRELKVALPEAASLLAALGVSVE